MTLYKFANNAETTVSTTLSASSTSLVVSDGSDFPTEYPYALTIWNDSTYERVTDDPNHEIVVVTNKTGNTFTITRAQEDTSPSEHISGAKVALLITAAALNQIEIDMPTHLSHLSGDSDDVNVGSTNLYMTASERAKLSGIEIGATADQTGAEIKTAYEAEADTNAFTDAEKAKLSGIEIGATADQTGAEIKTAYEAEADTNAFTDAEKAIVANTSGINTGDQTTIVGITGTKAQFDAACTDGDFLYNGDVTVPDELTDLDTTVTGTELNSIKTKVDGIEAGADVTDATNVAAAGAVMNTGDESIDGVKSFSSFPVTPSSLPVSDYQTANKKYVDGLVPATRFAVIGVEWDTSSSSPTLKHIDINGNELSLTTSDFDNHAIWGNIRRCVIDPTTGGITYGSNARGDGLTLDGSAGNVMVEIPGFYTRFASVGSLRRFWVSPVPISDFRIHPFAVQRGGTVRPKIYVSAYEAAGFDDAGTFKLKSATGLQPVTGGVAYTDLPNSGRFIIDDAETYANNIGSGYGCMNIWTMSALKLLFMVEYASLDSQTTLGRGIVDLDSGTGFAGENTGADSADTNIGVNGTGVGTGINGETPIVYRGIENLWGNIWKFVIGYNAVDAGYRITKRNGTGTLAGILSAGEYESSTVTPATTDGYGTDIETEDLLSLLMIPSTVGGSSSAYLCDYFCTHDVGETNVLFSGGHWSYGSNAGVGCLTSCIGSSSSVRNLAARFELIP